jgi:serine/threonine protein kinase/Tfp pilus assembly protein PilF
MLEDNLNSKIELDVSAPLVEDSARVTEPELENIEERWEIVERLGVGGMSAVYKARHRLTGKICAIKVLLPEHKVRSQSLKRFEVEAKAISKLDHAHIVHLSDCGTTSDGHLFIVMDFADGISLADLLVNETRLDGSRALKIFQQISDALAHAHRRGIIHRDLKPSNIMLVTGQDFPDFVKVVDFGIAKVVHPDPDSGESLSATATGEVFGSPLYMSPEQYRGKQLDNRSDIYSMGCLMYETLTGNPPFIGDNPLDTLYKHVSEQPKPFNFPGSNDAVMKQMEGVVLNCLAKEPDQRYESMDALKADLDRVAQKEPVARKNRPGDQNGFRNSSWTKVSLAVAAAILAGIATAVVINTPNANIPSQHSQKTAEVDYNGKTLAQLNEEIEEQPSAALYLERGKFYSNIKDQRPNAIADYTQAISLNPNLREAYRERSDAHLMLNQFSEALSDINHAIKLDPRLPLGYYNLARIHNALENYRAAAIDARRGLGLQLDERSCLQELSYAYNGWRRYDDAIKISDKLINENGDDAYFLGYRSLYHLHRADFDKALADGEKAVDLDPRQRMLYAFALEGKGETEQADAEMAKAMQEETFPARAHRMRGELLRYRGQLNDAVEEYSAAIALEPTYAQGIMQRGVAYYRLNQFKNALIDFAKAADMNPGSALSLAWKAVAEEKLGKHMEADSDMEAAMHAPTVIGDVLANRAAINMMREKFPEAKSDATLALKMNPYNTDAIAVLEELARKSGRLDEAAKLKEKLSKYHHPGSTPQIGW